MTIPLPSTPSSDNPSPPHETIASTAPPTLSIDPFAVELESWDEWEQMLEKLLPPAPGPPSNALPIPPKINLLCTRPPLLKLTGVANDPLPFTPAKGPIDLYTPDRPQRTRRIPSITIPTGDAMQIDGERPADRPARYEAPRLENVMHTAEEQTGVRGTQAPPVDDEKELEFDWPNEEIRKACEALFPKNDGAELPVLDWIADEVDGGQ